MREESDTEQVSELKQEVATEMNIARAGNATSELGKRLNHFDYFTEIEDFFIGRRGKTLLLSPMDWALIESWKQKGVPLHVALRGIERAFDSYDKRPAIARRRSIKTLLYCEEEVEAQYAEWLESQTGKFAANENAGEIAGAAGEMMKEPERTSSADPFPPHVVLEYLKNRHNALAIIRTTKQDSAHLSPAFCEALVRVEERLSGLIRDWQTSARPSAERLEDALTQLEKLLDENLRTCFSAIELNDEEQHARQQLAAYKKRMAPTTYETTLAHLLVKRLRERRNVPRLSLFHL
jgi:hypothetical protein